MTTYRFECTMCGYQFDIECSMKDYEKVRDSVVCQDPECASTAVVRIIDTAPAVHYKGGGWGKDSYSK